MPNLPRMIGEPERSVQLRQAVVSAAPAGDGTLTIKLGNGSPIAGVRRLSGADVVNGDSVWVMQQGYDLLVIGRVAPAMPTAHNVRQVGLAVMGTHPVHTSYAWFGHRDFASGTLYSFLTNGDESIVNADSNTYMSVDGSWRWQVHAGGQIGRGAGAAELTVSDTNTFRANYGFTMNYQSIFYLRGYGDGNHAIRVPNVASYANSTWGQDGPVINGWSHIMFANRGNWRLVVSTDDTHCMGRFSIGGHATWDAQTDFEALTTYGGASGISMRQRTRGWNDTANRAVIYPGGDHMTMWVGGLSRIMHMGWNTEALDNVATFIMAVPVLGGGQLMNLQVNGSWQVGTNGSAEKLKLNIRDLDASGEANPVWDMRPVRFDWNPEFVANADEMTQLFPEGVAGLTAEEVADCCPDAVIFGDNDRDDGEPTGLDNDRLIAYLVDAVQYLDRRVAELEG